jgi:hypothetical protein
VAGRIRSIEKSSDLIGYGTRIKMDLSKIEWEGMGWIPLAESRD